MHRACLVLRRRKILVYPCPFAKTNPSQNNCCSNRPSRRRTNGSVKAEKPGLKKTTAGIFLVVLLSLCSAPTSPVDQSGLLTPLYRGVVRCVSELQSSRRSGSSPPSGQLAFAGHVVTVPARWHIRC